MEASFNKYFPYRLPFPNPNPMRKILLLSMLFVCFAISKNLAQCSITTSVITGSPSVCANTTGITYSVTNNAGSTYAWTITGGTPVAPSTTNSINVNWGAAGSGNVKVVETFSGGCVGAAVNLAVTINAPPNTPPISGNTIICQGVDVSASYSVAGSPGSSYMWTATGGRPYTTTYRCGFLNSSTCYTDVSGTVIPNNSINVLWNTPATGTLTVVEYQNGCPGAPVTLTTSVQTTPPAVSAPSPQLCVGASMQLSPSTGGSWSGSNSIASVTSSGLVTGLAQGPVTFAFVSSSGCTSILNVYVGVSEITEYFWVSGATPICANQSSNVTYSAYFQKPAYTYGQITGTTYFWTVTGGTIVSGQNTSTITVNWGASTSGNVSFVETYSGGCSGSQKSLPVTINPSPATSPITGNTNVWCNTSGTTYSVTNTPGSTYVWTITGGYPAAYSNTNTVTVNWGAAGSGNVSVTETNSVGCDGIPVNLPVTVKKPVTSSITGSIQVCSNSIQSYSVINTPGSTYSWEAPSGTIVSGANTNSITVNFASYSSQTPSAVWVVETNSGCSGGQDVLGINVNPNPAANTISGSTIVCQNTNSNYYSVAGGTGSTYQWTITGGTQTSGGTSSGITVNWTAPSSGNIKVVETNSYGCVGNAINLPVTIKPVTTSSITGNSSVCINTNGVAYSVTNTTGSSYAWTITGGTVTTGSGTSAITANWTTAGTGNVKVVETSAIGCVGAPVNKSVTVNPLPVTSTITGSSPVCTNMTGAVYSVTNTTGSSYTWTVTGTTGSTLVSGNGTNSIIANWGSAGTGNVSVTETSAAGCVGIVVNKPITIKALPTTSAITGSATACPNATGIAYSVTNTSGSTYNWSITGGTKATGGTTNAITVNWGPGGPGNVSVVETNAAGCVGTTISKAVTVSPFTSSIAGSINVCPNSNGVAYSVANVTGNTYTWTATGGTVVCGQNTSTILVNWGATGPGTLNVTERSATCTGIAVNLPVTITASPATGAITGNSTVCSNASGAAYSVTNTSGSTYAWTVTGGTLVSGAGTNNITVNWSAAGTGNISVIETTSTGCVGTAVNKIITITSVNTGIISGNSSMCLPANGVVYSVANTAGSTYVWSINGGTQVSGGTTNSITVNWGPAGPGSVNVKETNSSGCVGNAITESVLVNPKPLTSLISGNAGVCANAVGVSYSVTNTTGSSYVWTIAGGTQASGSTTNSITANWGAAGAGNVSVVETNYLGCVGTTVGQSVTINAKPSVSIYASSYSICSGSSSTLTASGASSYSWSTGASTVAITVNPSSSTTYTVTGTTNGCSATASATITVGSGYGYVTPSSVDLCTTGGCTTLQAGSGSGYSWSTGSSASSISVCSAGTYTVRYTVNGCNVTASANVYQGTSNQPPIEASVDPVDAKKVEVSGKSTTMAFTQTTGSGDVSVPKDVNHIDTYIPCGPLPQAQQTTQLEKENTSFSIYPNPAFTHATVILSKAATEDSPVLWFDMSGRQVKTSTIEKGNKEKTFQIDELDAGVYLVRVKDNGQLRYSKIIVTK